MRLNILTFLILAICKQAIAQTKIWDKTLGGNNYDYPKAIVTTPDGGYIIAGTSFSEISGDKSEGNKGSGGADFWIVKIDASGQKIWDKTIGGSWADYGQTIVASNDEGVVIVGTSYSFASGDKSEDYKGGADYWIVKLSSQGQKVWDKTIGGSEDDLATSVTTTNDGGVVVAGSSQSDISGDKSESSKGGVDYWIVKLNSSGQKIWDKTIGGSNYEAASSIVATSDGGFVVSGHSYSNISGDKSENSKGGADYWVVKINANGQKIWDRTIGGAGTDANPIITATNDGGFIVTGDSQSGISGDKSEGSKGYDDYWIIKLNANGQKIWDKTIGGGGPYFNSPYFIHQPLTTTSDGGFIVVGTSASSISGDKSENPKGDFDYWVVKLGATGQKVWDKTIGGSGRDEANAIIATIDGGFIIAGTSFSNVSGDKTEPNKGYSDFWIVKIQDSTIPIVKSLQTDSTIKKGTPLKINFKATSN